VEEEREAEEEEGMTWGKRGGSGATSSMSLMSSIAKRKTPG
jgi:hypothetical protein